MRVEPSKLAQLVIAYHEKFGRHVPEPALRLLDAGDLAATLQNSLATGVPLSETGWSWDSPMEFSPRGCCIVCGEPEHQHRRRGPTAIGCNRGPAAGIRKTSPENAGRMPRARTRRRGIPKTFEFGIGSIPTHTTNKGNDLPASPPMVRRPRTSGASYVSSGITRNRKHMKSRAGAWLRGDALIESIGRFGLG
jgi:hypothetical protein